jgi:hypothetical protein
MALPHATLRQLERLAPQLPDRIASSVVHLFRDSDGAKKLRDAFHLVELLTMELLDRLNSTIVDAAPPPSTDLLRVLFEFARKETRQFSLGDRVRSIVAFTRFFGARDAPRCEAFPEAVALLVTPLPEATGRMVRCLTVAREGRRDYEIPAARVRDYVTKNLGSGRTARLGDLTSEFVQWRNADAHVDDSADSSKRWYQGVAKDEVWLSTLAGWLDEGIAAFVLWDPFFSLLCRTGVRTLRTVTLMGADAWSAEIAPTAMQIVPERATGRGLAWEGEADWWVVPKPAGDAAPLALCRRFTWPTAPAPSAEAAARYRSQVALAWLQVGFVTEDQREELEATAREGLLPDRQSAEIRDGVRDLVARSMRGDGDAQSELVRLVPVEALTRLPLDALASRRLDAVFALVEDAWPISPGQLVAATGLSVEELADVLRELEIAQRITRRSGSGDAEEIRPRWKELTDAEKLLKEVALLKRLTENDRRLSATVVALARLLDERFPDPFDAPRREEPLQNPWVLTLDGGALRANSLESLCAELARHSHADGTWAKLAASLPWKAPDGSVLLAEGNDSLTVEVKTPGVGRTAAMYTLEKECATLGWLTVLEEGERADVGDVTSNLWIEVRASAADRWTRIEGGSVRSFLGHLVRWLYGARHFNPGRLPVASGHSRFVINSEPLHQSGSSYLAPLHCLPGVYVETHNSRSGALSAARKVCVSMRVDVQGADDIGAGLAPVLALADAARVRPALALLYDTAHSVGLLPRYDSRSVVFFAPGERGSFALLFEPRSVEGGGVLHVECSPRVFESKLAVAAEAVLTALGGEQRDIRSLEEATSFSMALKEILIERVADAPSATPSPAETHSVGPGTTDAG